MNGQSRADYCDRRIIPRRRNDFYDCFGDGNGRISRLLMNYVLNKKGYPMLIIDYTQRKSYYTALERSNIKNDESIFTLWFFRRYLKENMKYLN